MIYSHPLLVGKVDMTAPGYEGTMNAPEPGVTDFLAQLRQLLDKLHAGGDASARGQLHRLLINKAGEASLKSYSRYSKFPVGAALLTEDGHVFTGCNVENASYGGTICAERTAIVKAVSEGFTKFEMIAVFCQKARDTWPCGICRQFISEFGSEIEIISEAGDGSIQVLKIADLLPRMFGPGALEKD